MRASFLSRRREKTARILPSLLGGKYLPNDLVVFLFCGISIASFIERLLRAGRPGLWLKDYAVEFLWETSIAFYTRPLIWLWLPALLSLPMAVRVLLKRKGFWAGAPFVLERFVNGLLICFMWAFSAWWWMFSAWKSGLAALAALALLAVLLALSVRGAAVLRRLFGLAVVTAGLIAILVFNAADRSRAETVPAVNVYDRPAYDAEADADHTVVIASADPLLGFVRYPGKRPVPIPSAKQPQRLYRSGNGTFYFANYYVSDPDVIAFYQGQAMPISFPQCNGALDVRLDEQERWLIVACEYSGTVDFFHQDDGTAFSIPVASYPYALAVDEVRRRVYVTSEILVGGLSVIELRPPWPKRHFPIGLVNCGVVVDPATGRVWVV